MTAIRKTDIDPCTCPQCGQRVIVRHGVALSPKKLDMFDMIERATPARGGISIDTLAEIFYSDKSAKDGRNAVKVTVNQINDLFASTDITIRFLDGRYRVVSGLGRERQ